MRPLYNMDPYRDLRPPLEPHYLDRTTLLITGSILPHRGPSTINETPVPRLGPNIPTDNNWILRTTTGITLLPRDSCTIKLTYCMGSQYPQRTRIGSSGPLWGLQYNNMTTLPTTGSTLPPRGYCTIIGPRCPMGPLYHHGTLWGPRTTVITSLSP